MKPESSEASGFVLDRFLPYVLSVTSNRVSRLFAARYSAEFGLTIAEWRVLAVIGRLGTAGARAIGERTAMDKVKVSRAVAALLARGLLRRAPDPQDGRAALLSFSRQGRAVYEAIVPRARRLEAELLGALSAAERAALMATLAKLEAQVRTMGAPGAAPGDPD